MVSTSSMAMADSVKGPPMATLAVAHDCGLVVPVMTMTTTTTTAGATADTTLAFQPTAPTTTMAAIETFSLVTAGGMTVAATATHDFISRATSERRPDAWSPSRASPRMSASTSSSGPPPRSPVASAAADPAGGGGGLALGNPRARRAIEKVVWRLQVAS